MNTNPYLRKYKITCLNCGDSDVVIIDDASKQVWEYGKKADTNFLSMRWRGDRKWGFECRCGNENRVAASEKDQLDDLVVHGHPLAIARIVDSFKVADSKQFSMEAA